jgi:saccharopine dehydrogenase-like NADP-dependent oxidoreductase
MQVKLVVLGGAGAMGQVIVRDLATTSPAHAQVVIADLNPSKAEAVRKAVGSPKVSTSVADLKDPESLKKAFGGASVVINSTPYYFNVQVMEAALASGTHYLDLGGLFHVTRQQLELNEEFKQKNLLAVLGMGAAPGITNVMAAHAAHELDTVETVDMSVAGVDFVQCAHPCLPPYALDTILDEYALEPWVFENGKFLAKPPMSGEQWLDLPEPVGRMRAFLTLHSEIATIPLNYRHKGIKNATYRLGLPAQFHERMKFLVDLGFAAKEPLFVDHGKEVNPRAILAKIIEKHPVPRQDPDDAEVIRVDVSGTRHGRAASVRMETTVLAHKEWKVSCGALDTGVPPSIVAQMICLGVVSDRGVLAPESCVPPELFFTELAKRDIVMRRITDETLTQASGRADGRKAASGRGLAALR